VDKLGLVSIKSNKNTAFPPLPIYPFIKSLSPKDKSFCGDATINIAASAGILGLVNKFISFTS